MIDLPTASTIGACYDKKATMKYNVKSIAIQIFHLMQCALVIPEMDRLSNKIVSQRTIQRQAVAQAQHIMTTTSAAVTDNDVSSDVSDDPVQISDSERSVNTHTGNIAEGSIHDHMSDDDLESILHASEEMIDEVHDSETDSAGSSDEDDNPTFKEQLREWVLNSDTPICHVNSLLDSTTFPIIA